MRIMSCYFIIDFEKLLVVTPKPVYISASRNKMIIYGKKNDGFKKLLLT